MMFLFKKFLTSILLPPGLFIVLLLAGAFFNRRRRLQAVFMLILACLLYIVSIGPTANALLSPLEGGYALPDGDDVRMAEAYVVLGGGIYEGAEDLFGKDTLTSESTARILAAYRLYRMERKPIILSGGSGRPGNPAESEVGKRLLLKLGVRNDHVVTETKSRDTYENAVYTKELCADRNIRKIILVTSSYHLKRSMMLFTPLFRDVIPCPSDLRVSRRETEFRDYFPSAKSFMGTSIALHEHLGILFYRIRPSKEGRTIVSDPTP